MSSTFVNAAFNISGYGLSQVLLGHFGVDSGQLFSNYLIIGTLYQLVAQHCSSIYDYILSYFTSCIEVDDWDVLYNHLIDWASAHQMTKRSRELRAVTFDSSSPFTTLCNREDKTESARETEVLSVNGLFNFQKWYTNNPLVYKPNFSSKYFSHNGRWFHWSTTQRANPCGNGYDRVVVIRCLGRSTEHIKDLLCSVKNFALMQENKTTEVYRSSANNSSTGGSQWIRQSVRPSRPMRTVSLDQQQKTQIVNDINEYLQPATAHWYAEQGIPYRRGYLFHGPPGTGKTSLSFALAGVFGLSIYCVSLGEKGLAESDLAMLFDNLPQRCIVLLEDIDTAGVRRESDNMLISVPGEEASSGLAEDTISPTMINGHIKPFERVKGRVVGQINPRSKSRSLISLAGLLNIIDGAASQEGRVLIMTTNMLETLDPALIRPGRVDLKIKFTLATNDQICDIYRRMYNVEIGISMEEKTHQMTKVCGMTRTAARNNPTHQHLDGGEIPSKTRLPPEELETMATQFASKFPTETFSPAEIQGFLLRRRTSPEVALQEVNVWREEQLKAKSALREIGTEG